MIQFVVEDGTGLSNSTSYISIAEFKQYWENRGVDYSAEIDAKIQANCNKAAAWIDELRFRGFVENSDQALQFPRTQIRNKNGISVSGTVPIEIKNAACEAGKFFLTGNVASSSSAVVLSKSIGPVSVTFKEGITQNKLVKELDTAEKILAVYIDSTLGVIR